MSSLALIASAAAVIGAALLMAAAYYTEAHARARPVLTLRAV